jgi:predicted Zn-dependent protease
MAHFLSVRRRYLLGWRFLLGLAIALGIGVMGVQGQPLDENLAAKLPAATVYPLPITLANWSATDDRDYFAEIQPSVLGYLVWSELPVKIYRPAIDEAASPNAQAQQQRWQQAVDQAIAAWSAYLPLVMVETPEAADIEFQRVAPPPQTSTDPVTGKRTYSFARNAETTYRFYLDASNELHHHMTVKLSPHQSAIATQRTARHELGHALGIWGHSLDPQDALYSAQTNQNATITAADINTLKKIYQQPTRLGGKMSNGQP